MSPNEYLGVCGFKLHKAEGPGYSPVHLLPACTNPLKQSQSNDPAVLIHSDLSGHTEGDN